MRRISLAWLLALLALISAAPQSLAAWMCEGRACSSSLLACCCVTPTGERDRNCEDAPAVASVSRASQAASAACNSGCNCVLTLKEGGSARATSASLALPAAAPAILPRPLWLLEPTPTTAVLGSLETRGPPLLATCLMVPVLRGPPALTLSNIGS